MLIVIND